MLFYTSCIYNGFRIDCAVLRPVGAMANRGEWPLMLSLHIAAPDRQKRPYKALVNQYVEPAGAVEDQDAGLSETRGRNSSGVGVPA